MIGATARDYSRAEALAALAWLVDAGCDVAVDDAPRVWLKGLTAGDEGPAHLNQASAIAAQATANLLKPDGTGPSDVQLPVGQPGETGSLVHGNSAVPVETSPGPVAATDLPALAAAIATWTADPLAPGPAVAFDGSSTPGGVLVIGDMPRADDIAAGRVAAGETGALLDAMLVAIGLNRSNTLLTNLVFRATPAGRDPRREEIEAAAPFLRRLLELARPRAVLALGGCAAKALSGGTVGLNRLRGRWLTLAQGYGGPLPLRATLHPATILADRETLRRPAWDDLQAFRDGPPA